MEAPPSASSGRCQAFERPYGHDPFAVQCWLVQGMGTCRPAGLSHIVMEQLENKKGKKLSERRHHHVLVIAYARLAMAASTSHQMHESEILLSCMCACACVQEEKR